MSFKLCITATQAFRSNLKLERMATLFIMFEEQRMKMFTQKKV